MGYFRELPELQYQSFLKDRLSTEDYIVVKNFFRRIKLRDDLQSIFTLFNKYVILDGERPDTLAEKFFGDSSLDWVVMISAGIINVYDEWPLSNHDLYNFVVDKYGVENVSGIHHYETELVVDSSNRLILKSGLIVDADFTIPDPDDYSLTLNPVNGITNLEYETLKNDKKREIYVLKSNFLEDFIENTRSLMRYQKSSEYINNRLIKTENTKVTQLD
tara:strand:+ start:25 stop:678 length:654 start_codon:yes stop_codon:yes gene_type:complete